MQKKWLKIGAIVLGCLVLMAAGSIGFAQWRMHRSYAEVPLPDITADTSTSGTARGELLFQALCLECHGDSDGRATGKHLAEVPAFLGTFYAANLAHPDTGVSRRTDEELARVLRFGVLPNGRFSPVMNAFGHLGDADIAALIGYMRSGAPAFEPAGEAQPSSQLSLVGALILTYVARLGIDRPATGVPVPLKAISVEYGRYMAQTLDCVGCHTDGFGPDKLNEPGAFAGGFELVDPSGAAIWTKNITPDDTTGIGRWSLDDFRRAVTRGVTPDGLLVRKPMPLFSRLDETDVAALYRFLRSVPAVQRPNRAGGQPLQKAAPTDSAEALFVNVGCALCHGDTGAYRDKLRGALNKSDAEIAAWILDPQATKPDTAMPSFRHALSAEQAEALARYVRQVAQSSGS